LQPVFQHDLGGHGVQLSNMFALQVSTGSLLGKSALRGVGSQALIDKHTFTAIPFRYGPSETTSRPRHVGFFSSLVQRQAHNKHLRLPVPYQPVDGAPVRSSAVGYRFKAAGRAGCGLSDCHADTPETKIKTENIPARRREVRHARLPDAGDPP